MDLDLYCSRVGLDSLPAADASGLAVLHRAQHTAIPFENLDISLGRPIRLDPASLFAKLVDRRRGGYCFELNGLLLAALQSLGFRARPLLARVHLTGEPSGRTHQLSLVEIGEEQWVTDVGFGAGGPRGPLRLEDGYELGGPHWGFRLRKGTPWGWMLQSLENDEWQDSYSFTLDTVLEADIRLGNHYTSTCAACHFTTSRVASLPVAHGRVSLLNHTLTIIADGKKSSREIPAGPDYLTVLKERFGIELDAAYGDFKPLSGSNEPG